MTDAAPPDGLRERIVARARTVRPPGRALGLGELPTGADLYRAMAARLDDLLDQLSAEQWHTTVEPYDWTVQGLIGHVIAIDRYTVEVHRRDGPAGSHERDHLAMTVEAVRAETTREPSATLADARASSDEVGGLAGGERRVAFHGMTTTSEAVLVIRAFEVWTHTDDIRRAIGRPGVDPEPEEVRRMSEHSLALVGLASDRPVRLVLTGAGGGTWQLGRPTPTGDEDALAVLDAVDYCRFAARRVDRSDLEIDITGDHAPVERLLDVARSMAV